MISEKQYCLQLMFKANPPTWMHDPRRVCHCLIAQSMTVKCLSLFSQICLELTDSTGLINLLQQLTGSQRWLICSETRITPWQTFLLSPFLVAKFKSFVPGVHFLSRYSILLLLLLQIFCLTDSVFLRLLQVTRSHVPKINFGIRWRKNIYRSDAYAITLSTA